MARYRITGIAGSIVPPFDKSPFPLPKLPDQFEMELDDISATNFDSILSQLTFNLSLAGYAHYGHITFNTQLIKVAPR
jgi:hypothetical protein